MDTLELPIKLTEFETLAVKAYSGTSFSPEKRGEDIIRESESELNTDLNDMPENEKEHYINGYKKHLRGWLSSKSNCISTMITGGSNFPVRRAEKANQSEHNRLNEFITWRENAIKAINKRKEANKPQSQKDNESFQLIRKQILSSCETIIGIDNGTVRGSSRPLFVSNLTNRINTIAKSGNVELITKCLDLITEINFTLSKPVISKNHSIWKLAEKAEALREAKVDRASKPNREYKFHSGIVIFNYEADRLQLLFDSKPEYETISKLKRNGFKWSPKNSAWQRQLTNNAIYGTIQVIGEFRPLANS